jgi:hypothetical protein
MIVRQDGFLPLCVLSCCSDGVADLPAIHLVIGKLLQVILYVVEIDHVFTQAFQPHDEILRNFQSLERPEIGIIESKLDAGLECFIESSNAVADENQDTVEWEYKYCTCGFDS